MEISEKALMLTFKTIFELKNHLDNCRQKQLQIGFVPTMGALHEGHISLIKRAKAENNIVVCSIFVNPTQFNDPKDLERYPRTLEKDLSLLENGGCGVVFLPETLEMYPPGANAEAKINLGTMDKGMEGARRPGHFAGVIQIVSRLFDAVEPDRSYFGQKDFQQLTIVREMVRQTGHKTEIVACPIVREANGLAMSSRNAFLSAEERAEAGGIFKTLSNILSLSSSVTVETLIKTAREDILQYPGMTLEYFEIVNSMTLQSVSSLNEAPGVVACIAVKLGKIRLIDNILLK